MSALPRAIVAVMYEEYAREYLRNLPPEHFMESTAQAWQRAITVACLLLVQARRPDFHLFSELLVQYPRKGQRRPGQVVPDNMVILTKEPLSPEGCYNVPLEPCGPFWTLEYVSKSNKRKDYDDNFDKYEKELKVPYYLIFYHETQDLSLYRHNGKKYVTVRPNAQGRYAIPEVEIEVAILDGWVRYWYQGELLPMPYELEQRATAERRRADEKARVAEEQTRRADEKARVAEEQTRRADELQRRVAELEAQLAKKTNGNGKKGKA